jgi:hypothetical protein
MTKKDNLLTLKQNQKKVDKLRSGGLSGRATLILRDAKTGKVKQIVEAENKILARGLDWIIAHIVSGSFPGSSTVEGNSSTYHGEVGGTPYITGDEDTNPFKYLNLLDINNGNVAPSFTEGVGNTLYWVHKVTDEDDPDFAGVDVQTFNERLGDASGNMGGTHDFSSDPGTRTMILGSKSLAADLNTTQSDQSNHNAAINYFKEVYLVFNFGTGDANGTINSICWSSGVDIKCVGSRLQVSPSITKTSDDTLDITYTFSLTPS